eukprot:2645143-Pyramimonas_sp.AAC.1
MLPVGLLGLARDFLPAALHFRTSWLAASCPACPSVSCPSVTLPSCPGLQCGDCNCPEGQATSLLWASAAVALCSAGAGLAVGCAGASLLGCARQAAGAAWGCPSGTNSG